MRCNSYLFLKTLVIFSSLGLFSRGLTNLLRDLLLRLRKAYRCKVHQAWFHTFRLSLLFSEYAQGISLYKEKLHSSNYLFC